MAGIYVHIPFCKQACVYCNFHFSTSLQLKNDLVQALLKEISLRKDYTGNESIETIYFGGGSPSLLSIAELELLINLIRKEFSVDAEAEITVEANPDDITRGRALSWKQAGINRFSLGIQSFFDEDLKWMNRAHTASQSVDSLEILQGTGFSNITLDLIYGLPGLTDEKWKQNVDKAISFGIPHLSCYALTVEPSTALDHMIRTGKASDMDNDQQARQFLLLMDWLQSAGYEHYEISNFAKPGMRSRHNSSYWQQKKYLGIGPSAHSFNGISRQWNIANNPAYIRSINLGSIPFEVEQLTPMQQLNEYIMTSLRTTEGIGLCRVSEQFGEKTLEQLKRNASLYQQNGLLVMNDKTICLTREGRLRADGIAADLFFEKM